MTFVAASTLLGIGAIRVGLPWFLEVAMVFLLGQAAMCTWWYCDILQREVLGMDLARWRYLLFNRPNPGYFFQYLRDRGHTTSAPSLLSKSVDLTTVRTSGADSERIIRE